MASEQGKKDIQEFNEHFNGPAIPTMVNGRTVEPSLSAAGLKLQSKVRDLHDRMRYMGNRPATVLWMRPFPFVPQGPISSGHSVPACPIGDGEFKGDGRAQLIRNAKGEAVAVKVVIPSYEVDVFTTEHGDQDVREVFAITIAEDLKLQAKAQSRNGIIAYMGDRDPLQYQPDQYTPEQRDLRTEMVTEEKLMVEEFKRLYQYAEDEYAKTDGKGRKSITDEHRTIARYLFHKRIIAKLPAWLVDTRRAEDIQELCPNCKAEPAKGALQCRSCFTWIKAAQAYKDGFLTLDDPNGVVALRRLTKKELEELELYPSIRPFSEVNAEKLAEMSGKKKQQ